MAAAGGRVDEYTLGRVLGNVRVFRNSLWRIEQRGEPDHFVVTSWRVDITNNQACTWSLPSDANGRTSRRGRLQGRIPEHCGRVAAHDHEASIAAYLRSLNRSLLGRPTAEADRLHHRMGWAHEQERRQTYGEFVTGVGTGPQIDEGRARTRETILGMVRRSRNRGPF